MDAPEAFAHFAQRCLLPEKARRFIELCATKKGQRKVLTGLYHEFEFVVSLNAVQPGGYEKLWNCSCFVFHESLGFGVEFVSVHEAYEHLSLEDGWLILLRDATAGIHRPEAPRSAQMGS
ncbi:MAG: hypothetical protein V4689_04495 [Verrucomicrobiota bacterium]